MLSRLQSAAVGMGLWLASQLRNSLDHSSSEEEAVPPSVTFDCPRRCDTRTSTAWIVSSGSPETSMARVGC